MEVIFNTDNQIDGKERVGSYFSKQIREELSRFEEKVTRIEVHLSDVNSTKKGGENDIKCVLEARPKGFKPVAVTSFGDNVERAISGAIKKVESSLSSLFGKVQVK
ncbi:MAG TPA: HPF/RaiA family ribosome-associated protein [Brumimicrobium sp.]|nr:HPF/RaiA family ribosome-associated protein [Brumimicrobium sp.]